MVKSRLDGDAKPVLTGERRPVAMVPMIGVGRRKIVPNDALDPNHEIQGLEENHHFRWVNL